TGTTSTGVTTTSATSTNATTSSATSTATTTTTTQTTTVAENPSISTDQTDYSPGGTVTVMGAGWLPNEAIHIFVNDDVGSTWSINKDVKSDSNGAFTTTFNVSPSLIAQYRVTATGTNSDSAATTFTDSVPTDFKQCANNDKPLALGACHWISSIL